MEPVKIEKKPWGQEIWVACTDDYALKIIDMNKGARSSLQYHQFKSEHIYVYSGRVRVEEEEDGAMVPHEYGPGEVIANPAGKKHRTEAMEDARLIEVSTPQLDDVIRVEDDYQR